MNFINKAKDRREHDWVYNILDKDRTDLKASPFLWTHIRAHIEEIEREKRFYPDSFFARLRFLSWVLPALFTISILFGVLVGRQLSTSVWHHNYAGQKSIQEQMMSGDMVVNPFQTTKEQETELPGLIQVEGQENGQ